VAARGATVELHGDSYHEAALFAKALARKRRLTFVHPYDDPLVIAGQGTIGMEILRQHPGADRRDLRPGGRRRPDRGHRGVREADLAAHAHRGRRARGLQRHAGLAQGGPPVTLAHVNIFADGVAVKQVGRETFRLCRKLVDEMVLVDTDEICAAIKDTFEETRTVVEPAGGLALAGMKRWVERRGVKGRTLVAIACGANMNFDRLRFVAERAELGEHREAVLAVTIPERPGSFRNLCTQLGKRSVTEFNYRFAPGSEAHVFLGVSSSGREETQRLIRSLERHGMSAHDLSDNELAKLHVRHLVGGRTRAGGAEMLYRFEFPERPGALMNFLDHMGSDWNITLFHYRNHGADVGRVLVGLQVPAKGRAAFRRFLHDLGYDYADESRNPAYRLFLR
jgi:threonine dehydratase